MEFYDDFQVGKGVKDKHLSAEDRQNLWKAVHDACRSVPAGISLAEELIAERRETAIKEKRID